MTFYKSVIAGVLFALAMTTSAAQDFLIAHDGQPTCAIVYGTLPGQSDQLALEELKTYLNRITGAAVSCVPESEYDGILPAMFIGDTQFARESGVDFSTFGPEEWLIQVRDGMLMIGGGTPRGTLYGVYDFLENQLGCHWYTPDLEVIPSRPDLVLPDSLLVRNHPALSARTIYDFYYPRRLPDEEMLKRYLNFLRRNRNNQMIDEPDDNWRIPNPFHRELKYLYMAEPTCHTFYAYVPPEQYFTAHPEYYSMNAAGERFFRPAGQLCLSNPEVKKIMLQSLLNFIKQDRKDYAREFWPTIYDISAMDASSFVCLCPDCTRISKSEGSDAALILSTLNFLCEGIATDYPELKLRTFAYVYAEKLPRTVRPHRNLIVWFCDLYTQSDPYRPLSAPQNAQRLESLRAWCEAGANVLLWDYWNMNSPHPDIIIDALRDDMKLFRDLKVIGVFAEAEEGLTNFQSFEELTVWLGYQLMLNPDADMENLIRDFLHSYYGNAAETMQSYLDFLRTTVKIVPQAMPFVPQYTEFPFLTANFLLECRSRVEQALSTVEPGSEYQFRLYREMTPILFCMLTKWPQFVREFTAAGLTREQLAADYQTVRFALVDHQVAPAYQNTVKVELEKYIEKFHPRQLPPEFSTIPESQLRDIFWPDFENNALGGDGVELREDPISAIGQAIVYRGTNAADHVLPFAYGLYDRVEKRPVTELEQRLASVPQDEQYHWIKIPAKRFGPMTILWLHRSWGIGVRLNDGFIPADGMPEDTNVWETWIHLKFTGPAYVPGSKSANGVWLDRVILARPGAISASSI